MKNHILPSKFLRLLVLLSIGFSICNGSSRAQQWTPTGAPNSAWSSLACSADGKEVMAAVNGGTIYRSRDFGLTWSATDAPKTNWVSLACSGDGAQIVAACGAIYTSMNSGGTWELTSAPALPWQGVASSADGRVLAAVAHLAPIYISTDSGVTWHATSAPSAFWKTIACSADGTRFIAAGCDGNVFISTDSGTSWVATTAPWDCWISVVSSADGSHLAAVVPASGNTSGRIYTSTNSGMTWTASGAPIDDWTSIASSADGTHLVAGCGGIYGIVRPIYTSIDAGSTWISADSLNFPWRAVASSWDGTRLTAAAGQIYSIVTVPAPPSATTLPANATNTDAVLNALVNANGTETSVWFEWGTNTELGNITDPLPIGDGWTNTALTAVIPGLTPALPYFYRVIATNSLGVSTGQTAIIQTPLVFLTGSNLMTVECHTPFVDPGAYSMAAPQAIAAGMDTSFAIKYDGTVAGWGENPLVPTGLSNVVAIAADVSHTLALKNDGTVVGWGGFYEDPADLTDIIAIAQSGETSMALNRSGRVIAWGDNSYGQTNVPPGLSNVVAIAVGQGQALALKNDGTVFGWGNNQSGQINIPAGHGSVVAIAAGLALTFSGDVVALGGQTNVPDDLSNVTAIAAGYYHNLALRENGHVVGWGNDFYGQASGFDSLTNVISIAAGGYHDLAVTSEGRLVSAGYDLYGQTDIPANLGGDVTVTGTVDYNSPGTYTLEYTAVNSLGGVGTTTRTVVVSDTTAPNLSLLGPNPFFLSVNTSFADPGATAFDACAGDLTQAVTIAGTVNAAVLGTNTLTYTVLDPSGNTAVTNRTVVTVAGPPIVTTYPTTTSSNSAVLFGVVNADGETTTAWFEWGTNILYGKATDPTGIGSGLTNAVLSFTLDGLSAGTPYHYRIVATNSSGRSVGRDVDFANVTGITPSPTIVLLGGSELTNECHTPFLDPGVISIDPVKKIAAGQYYSLALKPDGTVAGWGKMPVVPPGLSNVTAVAAGYIHSLALKTDGTVVGWGDNGFGETNTPVDATNVVAVAAGWGYSLALRQDGSLVGWGTNDITPAAIPSGLGHVTAISVGFDLCLALKEDGTVVGWGHPSSGGTVPPDGLSNVVDIAAGESDGLALKSDGTVVGWGYNAEGQATPPAGLSNVIAIAAGFYHSLALKRDGTVVGWGDNFYGEATPPAGLKDVVGISAGAYHSLALKRDGTVVGWGFGPYGETDVDSSGSGLVTKLNIEVNGAVNANDPGAYALVYLGTNSTGQSVHLKRRVHVVDTTPPTFSTPSDLIVEFANANGASVFFKPTASDSCSSSVHVTSIPRSGAMFPFGTTSVRCTAIDPSGNKAFVSFQVTVLGAEGVISNVLSDVEVLSATNPPASQAYITGAITNLQQSLTDGLWVDQTHLSRSAGGMAFTDHQAAVQALSSLITKHNNGNVPNNILRNLILRIIKSDRLLASIAIEEIPRGSKNGIKLHQATLALSSGDQAVAASRYASAVRDYFSAWSKTADSR